MGNQRNQQKIHGAGTHPCDPGWLRRVCCTEKTSSLALNQGMLLGTPHNPVKSAECASRAGTQAVFWPSNGQVALGFCLFENNFR